LTYFGKYNTNYWIIKKTGMRTGVYPAKAGGLRDQKGYSIKAVDIKLSH